MEGEFIVLYKNFMNNPSVGNLASTTHVYFTIWTDQVLQERDRCQFNITIAPQASVDVLDVGYPLKFVAK